MAELFTWQMVKHAIDHFNGKASNNDLRDYINSQWKNVNPGTLAATIILLTVNHDSRIHYPENQKPRLTTNGSNYDLLFRTQRGEVVKYDPSIHGIWEIYEPKDNKLGVRLYVEADRRRLYTPADIIWIKNVSNATHGEAYLGLVDSEFVLHFPTHHKGNVLKPMVDELILIYQKVHGVPAFTHLVTPIDDILLVDNERPEFRYSRKVKILAKTDQITRIPVTSTLWARLNFAGFSQGNACKIDSIKNIGNSDELRFDIWQRFSDFFVESERQSVITTSGLMSELDNTNPDLTVVEGELKLVTHITRERNRKIVSEKKQQAINNNTLKCEVCHFSFSKTYDANFIECHHIVPISTPGRIMETKLEDLALVCANCHRMLHTKFANDYLSIEQLQQKIFSLSAKEVGSP